MSRLKTELSFLRRRGAVKADDDLGANNPRACGRCRVELGLIINRGATCPACRQKVCKQCREITEGGRAWVCVVCHKHIEIQLASGEWMNEFVRRPSRRRENHSYVPPSDLVKRSLIKRSWTISSPGGDWSSPDLRVAGRHPTPHKPPRGHPHHPRPPADENEPPWDAHLYPPNHHQPRRYSMSSYDGGLVGPRQLKNPANTPPAPRTRQELSHQPIYRQPSVESNPPPHLQHRPLHIQSSVESNSSAHHQHLHRQPSLESPPPSQRRRLLPDIPPASATDRPATLPRKLRHHQPLRSTSSLRPALDQDPTRFHSMPRTRARSPSGSTGRGRSEPAPSPTPRERTRGVTRIIPVELEDDPSTHRPLPTLILTSGFATTGRPRKSSAAHNQAGVRRSRSFQVGTTADREDNWKENREDKMEVGISRREEDRGGTEERRLKYEQIKLPGQVARYVKELEKGIQMTVANMKPRKGQVEFLKPPPSPPKDPRSLSLGRRPRDRRPSSPPSDSSRHSDTGHSDHSSHRHSDQSSRRHSDHSSHRHSEHTSRKHSDHSSHKHSDHSLNRHSDHTPRKHSDHISRRHSSHSPHRLSENSSHRHSSHSSHRHSDHSSSRHSDHSSRRQGETGHSSHRHSEKSLHKQSDGLNRHSDGSSIRHSEPALHKQSESSNRQSDQSSHKQSDSSSNRQSDSSHRHSDHSSHKQSDMGLSSTTSLRQTDTPHRPTDTAPPSLRQTDTPNKPHRPTDTASLRQTDTSSKPHKPTDTTQPSLRHTDTPNKPHRPSDTASLRQTDTSTPPSHRPTDTPNKPHRPTDTIQPSLRETETAPPVHSQTDTPNKPHRPTDTAQPPLRQTDTIQPSHRQTDTPNKPHRQTDKPHIPTDITPPSLRHISRSPHRQHHIIRQPPPPPPTDKTDSQTQSSEPRTSDTASDIVLDSGKIQPEGDDYKIVFISSDSSKESELNSSIDSDTWPSRRVSSTSAVNDSDTAGFIDESDWDYYESRSQAGGPRRRGGHSGPPRVSGPLRVDASVMTEGEYPSAGSEGDESDVDTDVNVPSSPNHLLQDSDVELTRITDLDIPSSSPTHLRHDSGVSTGEDGGSPIPPPPPPRPAPPLFLPLDMDSQDIHDMLKQTEAVQAEAQALQAALMGAFTPVAPVPAWFRRGTAARTTDRPIGAPRDAPALQEYRERVLTEIQNYYGVTPSPGSSPVAPCPAPSPAPGPIRHNRRTPVSAPSLSTPVNAPSLSCLSSYQRRGRAGRQACRSPISSKVTAGSTVVRRPSRDICIQTDPEVTSGGEDPITPESIIVPLLQPPLESEAPPQLPPRVPQGPLSHTQARAISLAALVEAQKRQDRNKYPSVRGGGSGGGISGGRRGPEQEKKEVVGERGEQMPPLLPPSSFLVPPHPPSFHLHLTLSREPSVAHPSDSETDDRLAEVNSVVSSELGGDSTSDFEYQENPSEYLSVKSDVKVLRGDDVSGGEVLRREEKEGRLLVGRYDGGAGTGRRSRGEEEEDQARIVATTTISTYLPALTSSPQPSPTPTPRRKMSALRPKSASQDTGGDVDEPGEVIQESSPPRPISPASSKSATSVNSESGTSEGEDTDEEVHASGSYNIHENVETETKNLFDEEDPAQVDSSASSHASDTDEDTHVSKQYSLARSSSGDSDLVKSEEEGEGQVECAITNESESIENEGVECETEGNNKETEGEIKVGEVENKEVEEKEINIGIVDDVNTEPNNEVTNITENEDVDKLNAGATENGKSEDNGDKDSEKDIKNEVGENIMEELVEAVNYALPDVEKVLVDDEVDHQLTVEAVNPEIHETGVEEAKEKVEKTESDTDTRREKAEKTKSETDIEGEKTEENKSETDTKGEKEKTKSESDTIEEKLETEKSETTDTKGEKVEKTKSEEGAEKAKAEKTKTEARADVNKWMSKKGRARKNARKWEEKKREARLGAANKAKEKESETEIKKGGGKKEKGGKEIEEVNDALKVLKEEGEDRGNNEATLSLVGGGVEIGDGGETVGESEGDKLETDKESELSVGKIDGEARENVREREVIVGDEGEIVGDNRENYDKEREDVGEKRGSVEEESESVAREVEIVEIKRSPVEGHGLVVNVEASVGDLETRKISLSPTRDNKERTKEGDDKDKESDSEVRDGEDSDSCEMNKEEGSEVEKKIIDVEVNVEVNEEINIKDNESKNSDDEEKMPEKNNKDETEKSNISSDESCPKSDAEKSVSENKDIGVTLDADNAIDNAVTVGDSEVNSEDINMAAEVKEVSHSLVDEMSEVREGIEVREETEERIEVTGEKIEVREESGMTGVEVTVENEMTGTGVEVTGDGLGVSGEDGGGTGEDNVPELTAGNEMTGDGAEVTEVTSGGEEEGGLLAGEGRGSQAENITDAAIDCPSTTTTPVEKESTSAAGVIFSAGVPTPVNEDMVKAESTPDTPNLDCQGSPSTEKNIEMTKVNETRCVDVNADESEGALASESDQLCALGESEAVVEKGEELSAESTVVSGWCEGVVVVAGGGGGTEVGSGSQQVEHGSSGGNQQHTAVTVDDGVSAHASPLTPTSTRQPSPGPPSDSEGRESELYQGRVKGGENNSKCESGVKESKVEGESSESGHSSVGESEDEAEGLGNVVKISVTEGEGCQQGEGGASDSVTVIGSERSGHEVTRFAVRRVRSPVVSRHTPLVPSRRAKRSSSSDGISSSSDIERSDADASDSADTVVEGWKLHAELRRFALQQRRRNHDDKARDSDGPSSADSVLHGADSESQCSDNSEEGNLVSIVSVGDEENHSSRLGSGRIYIRSDSTDSDVQIKPTCIVVTGSSGAESGEDIDADGNKVDRRLRNEGNDVTILEVTSNVRHVMSVHVTSPDSSRSASPTRRSQVSELQSMILTTRERQQQFRRSPTEMKESSSSLANYYTLTLGTESPHAPRRNNKTPEVRRRKVDRPETAESPASPATPATPATPSPTSPTSPASPTSPTSPARTPDHSEGDLLAYEEQHGIDIEQESNQPQEYDSWEDSDRTVNFPEEVEFDEDVSFDENTQGFIESEEFEGEDIYVEHEVEGHFDSIEDGESNYSESLYSESSGDEGCDREEELRGYCNRAIDFTLHTIIEESCEESDYERKPREEEGMKGDPSELEKYFYFGLGNGPADPRRFANEESEFSDTFSETSSSIFSEGMDNDPNDEDVDPAELASSRLEKYFLTGFMFERQPSIRSMGEDSELHTDESGSVGSDSEGSPSPEQPRKKLVRRPRGFRPGMANRCLIQSGDRYDGAPSDGSHHSEGDEVDRTLVSGEDEASTESEETAFDKGDGQFDTIKRRKKKKNSGDYSDKKSDSDKSELKTVEQHDAEHRDDLADFKHCEALKSLMHEGEKVTKRVTIECDRDGRDRGDDRMEKEGDLADRKYQSRDSGFIGSSDDLLKDKPEDSSKDKSRLSSESSVEEGESSSKRNDNFQDASNKNENKSYSFDNDSNNNKSENEGRSSGDGKVSRSSTGSSVDLPPFCPEKMRNKICRKDSFNNWSSDEETNMMMNKMRAFFKTMIFNNREAPKGQRVKPPQLLAFEAKLTNLMKTVPGINDDQVKEIVEYLSSEDTWSDSYDSSDYTSSDLEGAYALLDQADPEMRSDLQEQISASCQQIIQKFDQSREPSDTDSAHSLFGGRACSESSEDASPSSKDTVFMYQRLMSSLSCLKPDSDRGSIGSGSQGTSPPLLAKVMHHIGNRLVALMHEVSGGSENGDDDSLNGGLPVTSSPKVPLFLPRKHKSVDSISYEEKSSLTSTSFESEDSPTDTEQSPESDPGTPKARSRRQAQGPLSIISERSSAEDFTSLESQRTVFASHDSPRHQARLDAARPQHSASSERSLVERGVTNIQYFVTEGTNNEVEVWQSVTIDEDKFDAREHHGVPRARRSARRQEARKAKSHMSLEKIHQEEVKTTGERSESLGDLLDRVRSSEFSSSYEQLDSDSTLKASDSLDRHIGSSSSNIRLNASSRGSLTTSSRGSLAASSRGSLNAGSRGSLQGSSGPEEEEEKKPKKLNFFRYARRSSMPDTSKDRMSPEVRSTTLPRSNPTQVASTASLPRSQFLNKTPSSHTAKTSPPSVLERAVGVTGGVPRSARYHAPGYRPPPSTMPKRTVSTPRLSAFRKETVSSWAQQDETPGSGHEENSMVGGGGVGGGGGKSISPSPRVGSLGRLSTGRDSVASSLTSSDAASCATQNDEDIERLIMMGERRSNTLTPLGSRSESMASVCSAGAEGRYGTVTVRGEVELGLQYNYKEGQLEVHVTQCRDLAPVDVKRNRSDPYVKVYLLPDKSKSGKRKTKVKKHTINPVFEEVLRFSTTMSELESRALWVSVWHSDMFGRNDFLGEVVVPLAGTVFDDATPKSYSLQDRTEPLEELSYSPRGDLILALKFVPPDALAARKPRRSRGALHVLVKEAKSLAPVRPHGLADPVCKGLLLPEKGKASKQKTSVCRKTLSPTWNHTLVFDDTSLQDLTERALELSVWDHDRLAPSHFLGGCRLSLGKGKHSGRVAEWMEAAGMEVKLWEQMLERPNLWVEGAIMLRPSMDKPIYSSAMTE